MTSLKLGAAWQCHLGFPGLTIRKSISDVVTPCQLPGLTVLVIDREAVCRSCAGPETSLFKLAIRLRTQLVMAARLSRIPVYGNDSEPQVSNVLGGPRNWSLLLKF